MPIGPDGRILHARIRSTTPPPDIRFSSVSHTMSAGSAVNTRVRVVPGSSNHEDDIALWLETEGTAVEGLDWDWEFGPKTPQGVLTIARTQNHARVRIQTYPSAAGKTIVLKLIHELNDASNKNEWVLPCNG